MSSKTSRHDRMFLKRKKIRDLSSVRATGDLVYKCSALAQNRVLQAKFGGQIP